ncbi:hydroxymethylbilane synthase NDAI_0E03290 [Naumovozyma dairenensis CBS 421]|uniref:Porphobilinogen deaminase n=1 Tax=Naumovozyma dairenensis (strain ATCC 10597 / BCRC 20456 / CBS 421 / NBRC 0211 / NRRL Y-12639) TaxID=1071378 RepID=G0WBM6_NAUDC|nr:hypothetical protein NDAI_0E03290 [Naumovozyma dairenensis CBS 421]CCD25146.1 hypothetical protein NDAI_0E03290 [Naumovozyma dairenensis CBS 421]
MSSSSTTVPKPKQLSIKIGGRRSKLAVAQSETIQKLILSKFPDAECPIFSTQTLGDQIQFKPLFSFGGKALWTKELEDKLYHDDPQERLDLIVHSLKDMPTLLPDGFQLGCITERSDPQDCLVMPLGSPYNSLNDLPDGAIVGTSSVRRSAQLKRKFPTLVYKSIRGNIHTRLDKLDDPQNEFQCIILAAAGLIRMGLSHRITQKFDSETMYHAVGQGALGIEIRKNDDRMMGILKEISHLETTVCCLAERSLMRTLEGGCSVPIGVESNYDKDSKLLILKGIVIDVEGKTAVEDSHQMVINDVERDTIECGKILAEKMIHNGAKKILDEINLDRVIQ